MDESGQSQCVGLPVPLSQVKVIETPRTTLRPVTADDSEAVFAYRSDAETNAYQGWIPQTVEEVEAFIGRTAQEFNQADTWFQLVIIEKESGQLIGDVGIHFLDDQQVELGCTLSKTVHGKGFATECMTAVMDHLFRNMNKHRIMGSIDPANTGSIKLVERLGFRKEAHHRESIWLHGQWVDDVIYAILGSEWKARNDSA